MKIFRGPKYVIKSPAKQKKGSKNVKKACLPHTPQKIKTALPKKGAVSTRGGRREIINIKKRRNINVSR
jgi:hypothetical protein